MDCKKSKNSVNCNCKHTSCSRHGICCECLRYHLSLNELPACCFPDEIADTDERSISKFVEINN
ncbi:MAG: DUF6485 family protein [Nanoarchaeota archaeon]